MGEERVGSGLAAGEIMKADGHRSGLHAAEYIVQVQQAPKVALVTQRRLVSLPLSKTY